VANRIRTRSPRGPATASAIHTDADTIRAHLEDAAHYPGGHAAGIAYPQTEADVAALLRAHDRILPVGAQSSLTGGATPFGDLVLSTNRLTHLAIAGTDRVIAGAGVPLAALEEAIRARGATYPPAPTFTGASVGGTVATNAAGAATFKYGSTREWVEGLTVVLASGEVLAVARGECVADDRGFLIDTGSGEVVVPVPRYTMPRVAKLSAGYHAAPGMDLVDLLVGSEGTLGIVTEVTLRILAPAPSVALALVMCPDERRGFELVAALRSASRETWRTGNQHGIDAAAIEHMDRSSLRIACEDGAAAKLNVGVPPGTEMALLVQLELEPGITAERAYDEIGRALDDTPPATGLVQFCRLLHRFDLLESTELAAPSDRRRADELIAFREAVPAGVNARVGAARRDVDPRIAKTAADMIVPFDSFGAMMDVYRRGFEARHLDYAVWGHASDGNVHPNVLPRRYEDVVAGREAILEFGRAVVGMGGSPLAEHGVGRNPIKQELLRTLYGDAAIEQMRETKRALDPAWKLAPGVIFPAPQTTATHRRS
jgi:D-lactate dehydrogenase (cytochrome)